MIYSVMALAALAAAGMAPAQSSGVKWVPLNDGRQAEVQRARVASPLRLQRSCRQPLRSRCLQPRMRSCASEPKFHLNSSKSSRPRAKDCEWVTASIWRRRSPSWCRALTSSPSAAPRWVRSRTRGTRECGASPAISLRRILYVTVNGRQIRLSGAFDDKGVAGGVGAVAVSALVAWPAGFFITGTSARLPIGTTVKGFVDEDVPLAMPLAAQAPLQVAGPAAPLQVQPAATARAQPH